MSEYKQLLKHPFWQRRRLEILDRDKFTCLMCGSTDKQLHVHHRYYIPGRMPWEYPEWAYMTLCFECHDLKKEPLRYEDGAVVLRSWEISIGVIGKAKAWKLACWKLAREDADFKASLDAGEIVI